IVPWPTARRPPTSSSTPTPAEDLAPDRSQPLPAAPVPTEALAPGFSPGDSRRRAGPRVLALVASIAVALAGGLAAGILPRLRHDQQLDASASQAASEPPRVAVAVARRVAPDAERVLPGNSLPLMEAALFARATGYLS